MENTSKDRRNDRGEAYVSPTHKIFARNAYLGLTACNKSHIIVQKTMSQYSRDYF